MTTLNTFLGRIGVDGSGTPAVSKGGTREDLCQLFADLGYRHGAEVGVWAGEFSETLCRTVPDLHLLCVDPWTVYKSYNEVKNNQRRLDMAYAQACDRLRPFSCSIMRMTSLAAAAQVPDQSLDFVYVDSNHAHKFVWQDLEAWTPKIRRGGVMAGHDYMERPRPGKEFIQVKSAVDQYTHAHGIAPVYVLAGNKSPSFFWVVQ